MYIYYSLPIYALSHARYKIMYMYQPTVPWRKEILLYFFTLGYVEKKKNVFCKAKQGEEEKAIKQN